MTSLPGGRFSSRRLGASSLSCRTASWSISCIDWGLSLLVEKPSLRERYAVKMPSKISAWFMILFFLLYGLAAFVSALALPWLLGILALGTAVFLFLDR